MPDFALDSDVVIWHLRGREPVVRLVLDLAERGRLALPAVVRAEVIQGMRDPEREATLGFLDACATLPVDADVADHAGEVMRAFRRVGRTLALPDVLIGATAVAYGTPLYTCNPRHYPVSGPFDRLDLRPVSPDGHGV